jgi:hypothetical protein
LEERVPETEYLSSELGKPGFTSRAFYSKQKGGSMILILVGLPLLGSVTVIIVWRKRRR